MPEEVRLEKYDQPTAQPSAKVAAGGIGGSISVVVIWLVNTLFGIEIPSEVAAAFATVISFVSAYFVRSERAV